MLWRRIWVVAAPVLVLLVLAAHIQPWHG